MQAPCSPVLLPPAASPFKVGKTPYKQCFPLIARLKTRRRHT